MIRSFSHKGLRRFFESGSKRGVPPEMAERLRRQLDALEEAMDVLDMNLPGYDLHQLKGDKAGTWAVTVRANWRLTFRFVGGDALDVNFEDYH